MTTTEYVNLVNTLEALLEEYKEKRGAFWRGAVFALEKALLYVRGEEENDR